MHKIELFASNTRGYRRYRIPSLVVTTSGTVLAFCEGRRKTGQDDDEIDILLRRSLDGGTTWEDRRNIVTDGERTCGNPCAVVDLDTGTIVLPFCKDNQEVYVTRSYDDALTWSEPEEITASVKDPSWSYLGTGPGHGIQLSSGRLLIPSWFDASPGPATWHNPPPTWGKVQTSFAMFSDDGGDTWQRSVDLSHDASDECQAVELYDGSLYMAARSRQNHKRRAYANSTDGGETWTDVQYDESLPEPSCQGSIVRLDDNRILMSHPANTKARTHMTVRMSYDEGRTWPASRVLEEGLSSYSDIAISVDGQILCFYETGAGEQMMLARFGPEWVEDTAYPNRS